MNTKRVRQKNHLLEVLLSLVLISFVVSSCARKPDWAVKNEELVREKGITGRKRADIPKVKLASNLEPGVVTNLAALPEVEMAPGAVARFYWGKGNLVCWTRLDAAAEIPREELPVERILVVMRGEVDQLINGNFLNMRAVRAEVPDGTHGGTQRNDFVYLEKGTENALKAGPDGAEILEVYSPPRLDYLQKAGIKGLPGGVKEGDFPLEPTVKPGLVQTLQDVQLTELSPGANSRLIAGRGAQLSFLRMNPEAVFPEHIHPEEQLMIVLRGSIDEGILDGVTTMKKDDILILPGDMIHGGTVGELGCDVLDVFWPPRPDYAEKMAERLEAYHAIIPEETRVELVVDGATQGPGLTFTEGPKWLTGKLYFSSMYFDQSWAGDPKRSAIVEMDEDGTYRYISQGQMQANGLMPLQNGNLAVCDMFGHRVIEMTIQGTIVTTLAASYGGKPLDGPNDLVVDAKGGLYFTDPQFTPDATKNQPGRAVYYLTPDGKVIRVIEPDVFAMPNGVLLSPDGKSLYVNNTYDSETFWNVDTDKDNFVWVYDVNEDGTLAGGRKFAELHLTADVLDRKGRSTSADGMTIDELGNIYVATYGGLQIFNNRGEFIGIVHFPIFPVSCCFGGEDMKTLYVVGYDKVYRIRTNMRGFQYPPR
ncbi:MAG TPA: SMP-30/gluconolactonase/LRE family protein [Candidatus Desulfaltia sp.]|nr:SMP-30/gluconolactonase/LRE family protein [Candidatus Desulfaltia sp.]